MSSSNQQLDGIPELLDYSYDRVVVVLSCCATNVEAGLQNVKMHVWKKSGNIKCALPCFHFVFSYENTKCSSQEIK